MSPVSFTWIRMTFDGFAHRIPKHFKLRWSCNISEGLHLCLDSKGEFSELDQHHALGELTPSAESPHYQRRHRPHH